MGNFKKALVLGLVLCLTSANLSIYAGAVHEDSECDSYDNTTFNLPYFTNDSYDGNVYARLLKLIEEENKLYASERFYAYHGTSPDGVIKFSVTSSYSGKKRVIEYKLDSNDKIKKAHRIDNNLKKIVGEDFVDYYGKSSATRFYNDTVGNGIHEFTVIHHGKRKYIATTLINPDDIGITANNLK